MLQTKKIGDGLCAVSFGSTEIMVRRCGKSNYGTERTIANIKDGKLFVYGGIAKEFGVNIIVLNEGDTYET